MKAIKENPRGGMNPDVPIGSTNDLNAIISKSQMILSILILLNKKIFQLIMNCSNEVRESVTVIRSTKNSHSLEKLKAATGHSICGEWISWCVHQQCLLFSQAYV